MPDTGYAFMTGVLLVFNLRDAAYPRYYIYKDRFDHIGRSLFFRLPSKILSALKFFGLYESASHTATDPILTALAFYRCTAVNWERTAVPDGSGSHDSPTHAVYFPSEDGVQAKKLVRYIDDALTTVTFTPVPTTFLAGVPRADLAWICQDYDSYRRQIDNCGEAKRERVVRELI